jgi:aarF domain-containing kinase
MFAFHALASYVPPHASAVHALASYVPPHVSGVGRTAVRMQLKPPPLPDFDTLKRLASPETQKELWSLSNELSKLAMQQDPKVVVRRSIDLALAVQTVTTETIRTKGLTPPTGEGVPLVLRRLCEEMGATYVKLGQFVASSPTLFPAEYVAEFQKCLDSTPPMAWEVVKEVVEDELGCPIASVYKHVETSPLASASIAQVHAATLLSGEEVVIKVQKVGVQASLRADLDLMFATSRVLEILLPTQEGFEQKGELSEIVGEIRRAILEEVDFTLEAQRTSQFADFLLTRPELQGVVTVPRVYPAASAARVLTLERLYGVSLTDLEAVRAYSATPELALITALNTWVSSVLYNEWFHADVHAGNLLILTDGRVAFIDFGIVGSIPPATASAMLDFVKCYASQDFDGLAAALAQMGFTKEGVDTRAFAVDLKEVLDSAQAMPIEELQEGVLDETQLNRLVASIAKVADGYGIRFPREFALLVKQVLYFDRYTRLLAPDLDILADERLMSNMPVVPAGGGGPEDEGTRPPVTVEVEAL